MTQPAMVVALEVVEGLKDRVWWVGLPRFQSRSRVAHLMQMLLIAWTVSIQEGRASRSTLTG